jgi:plasmid stabilization system protein ParE
VKVVTTPKASKDLEDRLSRIAAKNPQAAESFLDRIRIFFLSHRRQTENYTTRKCETSWSGGVK